MSDNAALMPEGEEDAARGRGERVGGGDVDCESTGGGAGGGDGGEYWEDLGSEEQVLACFTGTKVLAYWYKSTNTDT